MKKVIGIFSLFLLVFVLGGCSYKIVKTDDAQVVQSSNQPATQQIQSSASSSEPTLQQQSVNLEMQQKCLDSASKVFKDDTDSIINNNKNKLMRTYSQHWNEKLQKCFILINLTTVEQNMDQLIITLKDVFGGNNYGFFTSGKVVPFTCLMNSDGTKESLKECKNETEFNDFVRQYMEN
jgi:hypothetical protein